MKTGAPPGGQTAGCDNLHVIALLDAALYLFWEAAVLLAAARVAALCGWRRATKAARRRILRRRACGRHRRFPLWRHRPFAFARVNGRPAYLIAGALLAAFGARPWGRPRTPSRVSRPLVMALPLDCHHPLGSSGSRRAHVLPARGRGRLPELPAFPAGVARQPAHAVRVLHQLRALPRAGFHARAGAERPRLVSAARRAQSRAAARPRRLPRGRDAWAAAQARRLYHRRCSCLAAPVGVPFGRRYVEARVTARSRLRSSRSARDARGAPRSPPGMAGARRVRGRRSRP